MNEGIEPTSSSSSFMKEEIFVRARREPFEYGLIPILKLIFSDGTTTLGPLKEKFILRASETSSSSSALRIETAFLFYNRLQLVGNHLSLVELDKGISKSNSRFR
ncbi:hypothetical protein NE237_013794 [Protea cynaroides]|uniref:Uncharacterized protein n=1 Tax=Protea cynaroides TaxID=273540 RepID=A0A9Q0H1P0_9MAGN|nr:hypothetical protein NE237_013794 [Protea cynaroides]